jgi:hypothetical protein
VQLDGAFRGRHDRILPGGRPVLARRAGEREGATPVGPAFTGLSRTVHVSVSHREAPARAGDFGLGDPFRFPFQTIESVLPLDAERLLVINDNNYPFSAGRNPALPDDTELIVVRTGSLK